MDDTGSLLTIVRKILLHGATIKRMYHYNPATALEELTEDATLPNPVHVRDMMLRRKLSADQSLELNRIFIEYQKFFGEAQKLGKEILKRLA
jgi:hypothetical protein